MKITLKRHGGLAALARPALVLDTAALGALRERVEALARAVSAEPGASRPGTAGSPHPDEFGYTLVIADAGGTHEVAGTETGASPAFAELAEQVRRHGTAVGAP